MIQISELRLGPKESQNDQRIALSKLTSRLNEVIRAINSFDSIGGTGGSGGGTGLQGPTGIAGTAGITGPTGPTGPSLTRTTVTITTAIIGAGSTENGTVVIAKGAILYSIAADVDCRVILYSSAADRTADAGRSLGTPAPPGKGVLAEFGFNFSVRSIDMGPLIPVCNADGVPISSIYYAITNNTIGAVAVNVDILFLPLET